jgi:hypothetical protein
MIFTARSGEEGLQVLARDEPHIDVEAPPDFTEVVDRYHVRVGQTSGRQGLPPESLLERRIAGQVLWQHLHGDRTLGFGVKGPPDLTHAAAAQQRDQPVASECHPLH